MQKKIKSLVVGLGNIGFNYDLGKKKEILSHCKALSHNMNYELIGGIDKNLNQLKKFKQIYKKPCFTSLDKALLKLKPELIVIACNTEHHFEVFKKIKKCKSLKYVLLEKPGTFDYKKLKKIFSFFEKQNVKVYVNYFRIYDNYYLNIAKKIKQNKKLEIFVFYNRGIFNNCGHFISFFNLFIKNFKKLKIFKIYKKTKFDFEADFQLEYLNAKINFFKNNIKEKSDIKIIINSEKGNWTSTKSFNEFVFSKTSKDSFLKKNKNYTNEKTLLNNYISIPQSIVYKKILKLNNKEKNFYKNNSINTLKILNNIILKIKKFNTKKI